MFGLKAAYGAGRRAGRCERPYTDNPFGTGWCGLRSIAWHEGWRKETTLQLEKWLAERNIRNQQARKGRTQ